ncbi:MAG: universal stress protein [Terriglobales bacterium]
MLTVPMIDRAIASVRFERVLFPTDFSPCSDRALTHLLGIAATYQSHVFILHVLPPELEPTAEAVADFAPSLFDFNRHEAEKHMRALENSGVLAQVEHSDLLENGGLCDVLENTIRKRDIDLVVIGSHGRGGIKKLLLGSIAEELSRRVPCAVMIVGPLVSPAPLDSKFRHILFATEFANGSLNALHYAISMAQKYRAGLRLLHVCTFAERGPLVDVDAAVVQDRERLQAMVPQNLDLPTPPEVITRIGTKTEAILATASEFNADLIIMGVHSTHALIAATHFPWTVAHQIICQATCPVLTVRG